MQFVYALLSICSKVIYLCPPYDITLEEAVWFEKYTVNVVFIGSIQILIQYLFSFINHHFMRCILISGQRWSTSGCCDAAGIYYIEHTSEEQQGDTEKEAPYQNL